MAREQGVSKHTVYAWTANKEVRGRVNEQRHSVVFFSQLMERYKREAMPERHVTASSYLPMLSRIETKWGLWRIEEIDVLAVESWLASLESIPSSPRQAPRPLSKKTLSNIKAMMHRVWQCGIRWGVVPPGNRMALVELRGIRRPRPKQRRVLTPEEFVRIAHDQRLPQGVRVMIQLAGRMGLGASEFLGLRWEDVDFDEQVLHVVRSVVSGREEQTKTPEREATLPIPGALVAILREWHAAMPDINGWVFGSPLTGRPLNRDSLLKRYLKPVAEDLGIRGMGWHSLRHTFRSIARDAELTPEDQRELMRHTDLRMTEHYGRESAQRMRRLRAAGEKVSALLEDVGSKGPGPKVVQMKREVREA